MNETTPESALLSRHPGVREHVLTMPEFLAWKEKLRDVEIDGETLFVDWGDHLKDIDQLIVSWVNQFRPDLFGGPPVEGRMK
jgi:hypothetical protein